MNNVLLIGLLAVISLFGVVFLVRTARQSTPVKKKVVTETPHQRVLSESLQSDIILNSMDDGVVLMDTLGAIQVFNPSAARMTGWQQQEAVGIPLSSVIRLIDDKNEPYTEEQNPFNNALRNNKTVRDNKAILLTRSNKTLNITISVSPLKSKDDATTGVVAIFRDVSSEREEERQRDEFISTASHEMRTPVAAIEGYIALAMNDNVSRIDAKAREYLQKAHTSTQQLGTLFQDLLTTAKAEDGRLPNHPVVVEMGSFLEHLIEDLRFAAQKKSLSLEFVVGTSGASISDTVNGSKRVVQPLYYVRVDPDRIREVVANIFNNAVKYTDAGKISIGLTGDDNVVQMSIKDTGPGVAPEDIGHLFQKFYRVDNSATRKVGGTGLGLFISRKIVELYNGRIWIESKLGEGSTFFINLPRLSEQKAAVLQTQDKTIMKVKPVIPTIGLGN